MMPGGSPPAGTRAEPGAELSAGASGHAVPGIAPGPGQLGPAGKSLATWLRLFFGNRLAAAATAVVVILCLFCFIGPLLYHTDQIHSNLNAVNLSPGSRGHPLGTDPNGMDELGRLMAGGQTSLEVGILAAFIATGIGTLWGAISGYLGGVIDAVMMRVVDSGLSFPTVFLVILVATVIRPTKIALVLVIALISWLGTARLIRAESLSLRTRDYVSAARAMGGGAGRVIFRHIIPNSIGVVLVNVTFQVADAVLILAGLGYLGLGLAQPQTDLGGMLSLGLQYVYSDTWWLIWPPGLMIIVLVAAINFIGDGMRDAFDTRLRTK